MTSRRMLLGALTTVLVVVGLVLRPGTVVFLLAGFVLVTPLERLWPKRPEQRVLRSGWRTDLVHLFANGVLNGAGLVLLVGGLLFTPLTLVRLLTRSWWVGLADGWRVALILTVGFVGAYWGHRLMHRVPRLWRIHAVHHSSTQLDWLASVRLHPLDTVITSLPVIGVLYALGARGNELGAITVVLTAFAVFQHANVSWRFPVVRWIVPTPFWHHWHHADHPDARDKNFGLPVLDLLFGTAHAPDHHPTRYGTETPVPPTGYVAQLQSPFVRLEPHGSAAL